MSENIPSVPSAECKAIESLQEKLDNMERFMVRRLSEISMEINATSQLLSMAEDDMRQSFKSVLGTLEAISYRGDGLSPVNAGVELDAVVKTTEEAANRILDAADHVASLIKMPIDWSDEHQRDTLLEKIGNEAQTILLACEFQDLTGQRIARTLENLRKVETDLTTTLKKMGINIDLGSNREGKPEAMPTNIITSQDDIDALFASGKNK